MSKRDAIKVGSTSPSDLFVFSGEERRDAHFVGHLARAADGKSWVGEISEPGGGTILLQGRLSNGKLALIAHHGMTADARRLRREEG